jgi:hypothetical protein
MRQQSLWDKFWKNRRGQIVIWQRPNIFLISWAALTFISLFVVSRGQLSDIFARAGGAILIIWSLLEMFKGVNYFRRLLGLAVLLFAIATLVKDLSA